MIYRLKYDEKLKAGTRSPSGLLSVNCFKFIRFNLYLHFSSGALAVTEHLYSTRKDCLPQEHFKRNVIESKVVCKQKLIKRLKGCRG